MDIALLIEKFESYAASIKEIKHNPADLKTRAFFNLDFEELQLALRDGCKFPLMLVLTPEVGKDGSIDNVNEKWEGTYMILDKLASHDNKKQCVDSCKKISDKVFNRMLYDASDFFDGDLVHTDEGMIGPTTDKLYGWAVPFTFTQAYNAELNPNDWEDLS